MNEKSRDVRTLLFCRLSPDPWQSKLSSEKKRNHKDIYKYINSLNLNGENNARSYFALGGFDALCIYPTNIQIDDEKDRSGWLGQVYKDKKKIIHEIKTDVVYHQMHLVTKVPVDNFWDESEKDLPFFLVTFVYGAQHESPGDFDMLPHLDGNECSVYEHAIREHLTKLKKDKSGYPFLSREPEHNATSNPELSQVRYAIYNGISVSDVVILWRTNNISDTLEVVSSLEQMGVARKTLTTVSFPMNEKGEIRQEVYDRLNSIEPQKNGMSVSIRGSIRDMAGFLNVRGMLEDILQDSCCYQNFGKNDFTIEAAVSWKTIGKLLKLYTNKHDGISDACWEIHTDLRKNEPDLAKILGEKKDYKDPKLPTSVLFNEYKKFLRNCKKYNLDQYPWCHAMEELLGTHSNIDRNPVLHGPSYLVYKSLRIANAYFAGEVTDFKDRKLVDSLLIESRDNLLRFVRNWDQLTEQIIRNDDVILSGRENSHTIHISLPESVLDFYHAFLRKVVAFLVQCDDVAGRKPEDFEYDFLLSPDMSKRFRFSEMFRTDMKYRSPNLGNKIWPAKQAYILELPIESVFHPLELFIPMIHECFHCFGDVLRRRHIRREYMALFIAANVVTALGFGSSRYGDLLAVMARIVYGKIPDESSFYLKQTSVELLNNTMAILGHDGIDRIFKELPTAYYLYSNDALAQWNDAKNHLKHDNGAQFISVEAIVKAASYYFKECYADAMSVAMLGLRPDEYLNMFRSEVELFDLEGRTWHDLEGGVHRKISSMNTMDSLVQRVAIVMAACSKHNEVKGFDESGCIEAINLMKREMAYGAFAEVLEKCYKPLMNDSIQMPKGDAFHPPCALQYVCDYLDDTINLLFQKVPCLHTLTEDGQMPYYLRISDGTSQSVLQYSLEDDFDNIIRKGDMFGKRFYQIIYEHHHDVRQKVLEQE